MRSLVPALLVVFSLDSLYGRFESNVLGTHIAVLHILTVFYRIRVRGLEIGKSFWLQNFNFQVSSPDILIVRFVIWSNVRDHTVKSAKDYTPSELSIDVRGQNVNFWIYRSFLRIFFLRKKVGVYVVLFLRKLVVVKQPFFGNPNKYKSFNCFVGTHPPSGRRPLTPMWTIMEIQENNTDNHHKHIGMKVFFNQSVHFCLPRLTLLMPILR